MFVSKYTGKVALEGNVKERLDQLDKRETELLEKVEQQTNTIKKLKEDRAYYHTKCDEKEYVHQRDFHV